MLVRTVKDLVCELQPTTTSEVSHGPTPPAAQSCVPHRAQRRARPPPRLHALALPAATALWRPVQAVVKAPRAVRRRAGTALSPFIFLSLSLMRSLSLSLSRARAHSLSLSLELSRNSLALSPSRCLSLARSRPRAFSLLLALALSLSLSLSLSPPAASCPAACSALPTVPIAACLHLSRALPPPAASCPAACSALSHRAHRCLPTPTPPLDRIGEGSTPATIYRARAQHPSCPCRCDLLNEHALQQPAPW
jgi:hypothetical protein